MLMRDSMEKFTRTLSAFSFSSKSASGMLPNIPHPSSSGLPGGRLPGGDVDAGG